MRRFARRLSAVCGYAEGEGVSRHGCMYLHLSANQIFVYLSTRVVRSLGSKSGKVL